MGDTGRRHGGDRGTLVPQQLWVSCCVCRRGHGLLIIGTTPRPFKGDPLTERTETTGNTEDNIWLAFYPERKKKDTKILKLLYPLTKLSLRFQPCPNSENKRNLNFPWYNRTAVFTSFVTFTSRSWWGSFVSHRSVWYPHWFLEGFSELLFTSSPCPLLALWWLLTVLPQGCKQSCWVTVTDPMKPHDFVRLAISLYEHIEFEL